MTKHAVSGDSKLLQFRVERSDGNSLVLTASDKQQFNTWQDEFNKVWLVVENDCQPQGLVCKLGNFLSAP